MENNTIKQYIYKFKEGCRINLNAEKVYNELLSISNKDNKLTPEAVLDWASVHPESELYKGFDWEDSIAANKWRLQQATKIIYSITVVELEDKSDLKDTEITVRPFINLRDEDRYQPIQVVLKDEEKYVKLKMKALNELISWKNKYSMINELDDLFNYIDNYIANK